MTIYRHSDGKQHANGSTWDPTKKSPNSATFAREVDAEVERIRALPKKKQPKAPKPEAPRDIMGEQHWDSGREWFTL